MTENNSEHMIAIEATPPVSQPKPSHTRTILEIVGAVVAVGLIFFSGVAGFVLGHVTAKHDGRGDGGSMMMRIERSQESQQAPDMQGGPGWKPGGPLQQGSAPIAPMR